MQVRIVILNTEVVCDIRFATSTYVKSTSARNARKRAKEGRGYVYIHYFCLFKYYAENGLQVRIVILNTEVACDIRFATNTDGRRTSAKNAR